MEDKVLKQKLDSIEITNNYIQIDKSFFSIRKLLGQGYHKQVFEIDKNKVLKIVRKDSSNLSNAFLSFQQAIEGQKILDEFGINYAKIIDFDKEGYPYRFLIQERINGISAAELIRQGDLEEKDIKQMAEVINSFEIDGKWQIDTSPFNWFKVKNKMIYTDGSVYKYDDNWSFGRIGLLQWIDPKFVSDTDKQSTKIPSKIESEKLAKDWKNLDSKETLWWKKYLHQTVQPKNTE